MLGETPYSHRRSGCLQRRNHDSSAQPPVVTLSVMAWIRGGRGGAGGEVRRVVLTSRQQRPQQQQVCGAAGGGSWRQQRRPRRTTMHHHHLISSTAVRMPQSHRPLKWAQQLSSIWLPPRAAGCGAIYVPLLGISSQPPDDVAVGPSSSSSPLQLLCLLPAVCCWLTAGGWTATSSH